MKGGSGYKLFQLNPDGSIRSLFVDYKRELPKGRWLKAKLDITPRGLKRRPGWHVLTRPDVAHLSRHGREMYLVQWRGELGRVKRPESQGREWILAREIRIIRRQK